MGKPTLGGATHGKETPGISAGPECLLMQNTTFPAQLETKGLSDKAKGEWEKSAEHRAQGTEHKVKGEIKSSTMEFSVTKNRMKPEDQKLFAYYI